MSEIYFESAPETDVEKEQALFNAFDTVLGDTSTSDDEKGDLIGELYGLALAEEISEEDIDRIYAEARDSITTATDTFKALFHSNPETFPGVPTDDEIKEQNKLDRLPTTAERQGFLEMWRFEYMRQRMETIPDDELEDIIQQTSERLEELAVIEREIRELRIIQGIARTNRLGRTYKKGQ
jgi:hypothetical protein